MTKRSSNTAAVAAKKSPTKETGKRKAAHVPKKHEKKVIASSNNSNSSNSSSSTEDSKSEANYSSSEDQKKNSIESPKITGQEFGKTPKSGNKKAKRNTETEVSKATKQSIDFSKSNESATLDDSKEEGSKEGSKEDSLGITAKTQVVVETEPGFRIGMVNANQNEGKEIDTLDDTLDKPKKKKRVYNYLSDQVQTTLTSMIQKDTYRRVKIIDDEAVANITRELMAELGFDLNNINVGIDITAFVRDELNKHCQYARRLMKKVLHGT